MKQYKLIRIYPGSPVIGTKISAIGSSSVEYFDEKSRFVISRPNEHPEFWEEIVEKDYEILSFDKGSTKIDKNKLWLSFKTNGTNTRINESEMIKRNHLIHSIKRLSDGEIFTIGEIIEGYLNTGIKEISVSNDGKLTIITDANGLGCSSDKLSWKLAALKKMKQPLFKTEDVVDIFEGDKVYYVETTDFEDLNYKVNEYTVKIASRFVSDKSLHSFSTKEKAEEFIIFNKPCLSIKDVQFLKSIVFNYWDIALKELVKSKL